jgi:hypothetical protein
MRPWIIRTLGYLALGTAGFMAFSWTRGQEQQAAPAAQAPSIVPTTATAAKAARDLSKLPPRQQQMYLSAQRGADWLFRMNGPDGRFVNGLVTSLKTNLDGDHYLRQVGAAIALARAARFTGDDRYTARARQAVLTLLADTALEPSAPSVRTTTFPPLLVNRLAAAGMLVQAIHELPSPADDLLEQAEQLCNFIRSRQQPDGSLQHGEAGGSPPGTDVEGTSHYPGQALHGLMLSQHVRPAAWKLDLVRKALPFYLPWWRAHKNMAFLSSQTAAYTEAFLLSQEKPFAEAVGEMTDWLCELQYPLLDPRHPLWGGGFMGWADGKALTNPPQVGTAVYAECLASGCRVARKLGDAPRYDRYREALERSLQFLTRLQYTDANTQHFADWYRPYLVGAFFASFQDGNIRIDYTQHALCALVQYLEQGAD